MRRRDPKRKGAKARPQEARQFIRPQASVSLFSCFGGRMASLPVGPKVFADDFTRKRKDESELAAAAALRYKQ